VRLIPGSALVRRLRSHFQHGGLIAYPTESCFGLGCDPRNARAVRRLLRLKGRPQGRGLILIADDSRRLADFIAPLDAAQQLRVEETWPGPYTWLIPAGKKAARWLRGRHDSIAVRVTAHPLAAGLCHSLGSALVSTSANRAGMKPLKTYADCIKAFGNQVLTIPGNIGKNKKPSTIRDLTSGKLVRG
jgi:L-threonylcarbamoyladenylate synthase